MGEHEFRDTSRENRDSGRKQVGGCSDGWLRITVMPGSVEGHFQMCNLKEIRGNSQRQGAESKKILTVWKDFC